MSGSPNSLFPWMQNGGHGLQIETAEQTIIAHEVFYEEEVSRSSKSTAMYLGSPIPKTRFIGFALIVLGCVFLLGARAFWMQVVDGKSYGILAERNRLRHEILSARRGLIQDSNGVVLAENTPAFDVRITERDLPAKPTDRDELFGVVARQTGLSLGEISAMLASSTDPFETLVVKRDLSYDQALQLRITLANRPGVEVVVQSKRHYPYSADLTSLSHVLGYVGGIAPSELRAHALDGYRQSDVIGKTGVEAIYESVLRGTPGERVHEIDSQYRVTSVIGERLPEDGENIHLAIDVNLQKAAEHALRKSLEQAHSHGGAVVAMDPQDGSIRAIVSLPSFDDNFFAGSVSSTVFQTLLENPDHPLLARAWAGVYPSGSIIKPLIATAALAEGVITPETVVRSTGGLRVGPWFFPDWKAGGHGLTNVRRAIAWSVNTFFYYVGGGYDQFVGLGIDRLSGWMQRGGLGKKTGVDEVGEAAGFVPTREWKKTTKGESWFIGDTYNLSIGQGDLLVTPLQMARVTAMVANGGFLVTPHVVSSFDLPNGTSEQVDGRQETARVAPADAIRIVQQGMRDTVVYGSGRALSVLPFPVAGKTGTAQWRKDRPNHAWFTSYGSFEHPDLVVTVLIEEGQEGSLTAVPVAKEVFLAWEHIKQLKSTLIK